jgi:hypothetical protein
MLHLIPCNFMAWHALELDDAKESGTSASHSLQIQLKYRRKASFR